MPHSPLTRRRFLSVSAAGLGLTSAPSPLTAAVWRDVSARPVITHGIQSGDVGHGRAIVWSRCDRPARMIVRYATSDRFTDARTRTTGPVGADTDFTAHLDLTDLPPGQRIVYEVQFEGRGGERSETARGSFPTPGPDADRIRVAFGGDTAGQGWGIDESRGGMATYESLRAAEPDLFIHSGDLIYADQPIQAEVTLDDGSVWRNLVTEAVSKAAGSLAEYRGRYQYNLLDAHVRRFSAEVPMLAQWDDHEVADNWYPGERLRDTGYDARFVEKRVDVLARLGHRAFLDYTPTRRVAADPQRIHRTARLGPLAEVFVVDCRPYRAANSANRQERAGPETAMLGARQIRWLEQALAASRATWKLLACDMPLGLIVPDGPSMQEGFANGEPRLLGREHEVADLLAFLKRGRIHNVVFVTADVHYAAAHEYHPSRATFTDFDPFWEFVAGPLHAGTFGPNRLDATFGPEVRFAAPATRPNRPPSDGQQYFGLFTVDARTRAATVTLHRRDGGQIFSQVLEAR
jgi:alkaline phosphatase D